MRTNWRFFLALAYGGFACLGSAVSQTPSAGSKDAPASDLQKALRAFQENTFDESAARSLEAAVKADPKLGTPRLMLSRWFFDARNGTEARAQLERAARETPRHPSVYLLNGMYAINDGRFAEALLNLERAEQLAQEREWPTELRQHFTNEAHSGLALAHERRSDWPQSKRYLLELDRAAPGNPQILQRLARANFRLGQDEEAARNLDAAFAKDSSLDPPELTLASLWSARDATGADAKTLEAERAKNRERTEEWFKRAREKYPADAARGRSPQERERAAKVYRGNAEWLLGQGNLPAAKALLESALTLDPDARESLALEGLYLRYTGNFPAAARKFEVALVKSPSFPFAMVNLALCLCESPEARERARGREYAEQFLKQNPQNPEAYAALGYCHLKQEPPRLDLAEEALNVPLRAGAVSPDTAYFVAVLWNARQNYARAVELLEKTLAAYPAFLYRPAAEKLLGEMRPKAKADAVPKKG